MMTHALASTTLTERSHVHQLFQVTSHIVGFRSVLHVANSIVVAVPIYSILTCTRIHCRHTAKTGLLRCCLYTPRRLQQTAVSCKRSNCNKIGNKKNKFVKVVRLKFYPKTEHNGFLRSIISLCMHPHLSTFFELL